jgi:hypothetical protein
MDKEKKIKDINESYLQIMSKSAINFKTKNIYEDKTVKSKDFLENLKIKCSFVNENQR